MSPGRWLLRLGPYTGGQIRCHYDIALMFAPSSNRGTRWRTSWYIEWSGNGNREVGCARMLGPCYWPILDPQPCSTTEIQHICDFERIWLRPRLAIVSLETFLLPSPLLCDCDITGLISGLFSYIHSKPLPNFAFPSHLRRSRLILCQKSFIAFAPNPIHQICHQSRCWSMMRLDSWLHCRGARFLWLAYLHRSSPSEGEEKVIREVPDVLRAARVDIAY